MKKEVKEKKKLTSNSYAKELNNEEPKGMKNEFLIKKKLPAKFMSLQ
jgi:hypothetical protein